MAKGGYSGCSKFWVNFTLYIDYFNCVAISSHGLFLIASSFAAF